MKRLDVVIDLETLSRQPDAAIISIAAVPFCTDMETLEDMKKIDLSGVPAYDALRKGNTADSEDFFYKVVNATTCALEGMSFDEDTMKFWSEASREAKAALSSYEAVSIVSALHFLEHYLERLKETSGGGELVIWTQGTDFDIPILKSAFRKVLRIGPDQLPWKYNNVHDARTFILEGLNIAYGAEEIETSQLYEFLPKYDNLIKHHSLHDAIRTALNVIYVKKMLASSIRQKDNGTEMPAE